MRLFKDLQPFRQMYICPQAALKPVLALPPQELHSCRLHRGRAAPWRMLRGLPVPGGELWMNRAASPLLSLLCCPHGKEEEQSSRSCHQHPSLLGLFAHPTDRRITEGASRAARGFIGGFAPNRRRAGLRGGRVCGGGEQSPPCANGRPLARAPNKRQHYRCDWLPACAGTHIRALI